MSVIQVDGRNALLARGDEAEVLDSGSNVNRLLADADTTDGAISANRLLLRAGVDGPPPHYHANSAEIFFVIAGGLEALAGDRLVTLDQGDFLVIPRNMPHAFAAPAGVESDVLILFAPGLQDRFEYFRLVDRVQRGQASPHEILATQDRFDNHFLDRPTWRQSRPPRA
jgi:mannose-6-phosphate isomerase-like protein (cupin superfamily)